MSYSSVCSFLFRCEDDNMSTVTTSPNQTSTHENKAAIMDDGAETGYVSDSSLNSRKGTATATKLKVESAEDRVKRKTKSERDKRRSSRISLTNNDSGSENSHSSLEQNQPRYRKRSGSKRNDSENKENRRRAGSKNSPSLIRIDSEREMDGNSGQDPKTNLKNASTTTLKMNSKDIYFGTWNPKERAVLDQVLHNIDLKPDHRRSFRDKLRRKENSTTKKEKFTKITEEEDAPVVDNNTRYPLCQYGKQSDKRKSILGIFSGLKKIKDSVLRKNEKSENLDTFPVDPLDDYVLNKKKKSIFRKFGRKKDFDFARRRAHSTNDYVKSVSMATNNQSNLCKSRSGSTHSLKGLFSRTKSMDNLKGAFEYYANEKEIFKRTPSVAKLDKFQSLSTENLNTRRGSQKSIYNGFDAVQPTSKELGYNDDSLVFAHAKLIQPHTASQRSLNYPHPRHVHPHAYYDSEDDYYRGYQSDRAPSVASAHPTINHHHNQSFSDAEYSSLRAHSSMSAYPCFYPPPPPRRMGCGPPGYYPPAYQPAHALPPGYCTPGYATPGYATPGYATPGLATPGYATPGFATPVYAAPGYATPGFQSGYTSENDYAQMPYSQISMVPYHARRAIQRSLSKNSAASNYSSNYGYASESSFCDDEDMYGMVQPSSSPGSCKLQRNLSTTSKTSQMSTML